MRMKVMNVNYGWLRRKAMMPAHVLLVLAGVFLILAVAAGCGNDNENVDVTKAGDTGGRLQVRETYFDAGIVKTGEKVEHAFELKNTGSGPLNLGQLAVKRLEGC